MVRILKAHEQEERRIILSLLLEEGDRPVGGPHRIGQPRRDRPVLCVTAEIGCIDRLNKGMKAIDLSRRGALAQPGTIVTGKSRGGMARRKLDVLEAVVWASPTAIASGIV